MNEGGLDRVPLPHLSNFDAPVLRWGQEMQT